MLGSLHFPWLLCLFFQQHCLFSPWHMASSHGHTYYITQRKYMVSSSKLQFSLFDVSYNCEAVQVLISSSDQNIFHHPPDQNGDAANPLRASQSGSNPHSKSPDIFSLQVGKRLGSLSSRPDSSQHFTLMADSKVNSSSSRSQHKQGRCHFGRLS